jgi:nitroimidazol reductase NimA-like FMN-containing flavoprotein (pyridoxamine 5'-phosphate oxidase superfamily)
MLAVKIYNASPLFSAPMSRPELDDFLSSSKLNLQLGTVDEKGEPMIHTVWYYYMNDKIYIETSRNSRKVGNIRRKNTVYFCIDDERMPYKGVRGKGTAAVMEDVKENIPIAERIMVKYTGSLQNPVSKILMDAVRSSQSVILEIAPHYYSTWDNGKRAPPKA